MMGRLDWSQRQFFYAFDLDAAVPLAVRMSSPPLATPDLPRYPGHLAYRWFCGLGLEDAILNHSAASRASTRPAARSRVIFTRMVATWPVPRLEL